MHIEGNSEKRIHSAAGKATTDHGQQGLFNMQTRGATAPLVMLHSPRSDPLLVGGGGISRSIMFELYSHIVDYKLQFSNGDRKSVV